MRQRVNTDGDDLGCAADGADDNWPATCHRFCNDEPEGLGVSAGVYDDVERA